MKNDVQSIYSVHGRAARGPREERSAMGRSGRYSGWRLLPSHYHYTSRVRAFDNCSRRATGHELSQCQNGPRRGEWLLLFGQRLVSWSRTGPVSGSPRDECFRIVRDCSFNFVYSVNCRLSLDVFHTSEGYCTYIRL